MTDLQQKMTFYVTAQRIDSHASEARCKDGSIRLDTDFTRQKRRLQSSRTAAGCTGGLYDQGD